MPNKKLSVLLILNALEKLGVSLPNNEARRLVVVVGKSPTEAAAVSALRLAIYQFSTDPSEVLATQGIGIKTFQTIQKLSKLYSATTRKKDLGIETDIDAAITLLRKMNSTMPAKCSKAHDEAKVALNHLNIALSNYWIEDSLKKAKSKTKKK
jgi:hypothetical protein